MSKDNLLRIEEVAVLIGVSVKTINNWYWYKRECPNDELSQMLPEYIQERPTSVRLWRREDLPKFFEFRTNIPYGRSGKMGVITQKYVRTKKEKTNETTNTQKTN